MILLSKVISKSGWNLLEVLKNNFYKNKLMILWIIKNNKIKMDNKLILLKKIYCYKKKLIKLNRFKFFWKAF